MNPSWMNIAILRVASLLTPDGERAQWLEEWRSELWYVRRPRATLFCLGAFRDALWVRRNRPESSCEVRIRFGSPLVCLGFLGILAAVSLAIAVRFPSHLGPWPSPIPIRNLQLAYVAAMLFSALASPAIFLTMPERRADFSPVPSRSRLRSAGFLLAKIALLQPALLCVFVFCIALAPLSFFAPYLVCAFWIFALRWILADQRRRCPVCLRLLAAPVRIGTPARTFLEPYAAGSICSRGHGLLQTGSISITYTEPARWLGIERNPGRLS